MTTCPLVYPSAIHDLFHAAAAALHEDICTGRLEPAGQSPVFETDCPRGCHNHRVHINVTVVRKRIIRINTAAHDFLKTHYGTLSALEQRAYHAGILDLSRQHLPLLDSLIVQKKEVRRQLHHRRTREREYARNRTVHLLVGTESVSAEHLLEFMSCYRKSRHADEQGARDALAAGVHNDPTGQVAYACEHCGGWHVGHPTGPTTPYLYRLSRAKMIWGTHRELANQFVQERGLYAHPVIVHA